MAKREQEEKNDLTLDTFENENADSGNENTEAVDEEDDVVEENIEEEEEQLQEDDETAAGEQLTSEQFSQMGEMFDSFIRRSVTLPSRKKQRDAFREDEEIIGDESGEIETYASLKRKEYEMLADSAKSKKPKVLYGRIDGVEELSLGDKIKVPAAVCHLATDTRAVLNTDREMRSSIYKILIPAPMLFIYPQTEEDILNEEFYQTLRRRIEMRTGSICEFIVFDLRMDDDRVMASRLSAMRQLSYDYYLNPKRAKKIEAGKLAKGYITYIDANGVYVDVMGAEAFIRKQNISWGYITNPLDEESLYVGKPVAVRVLNIEKAVHDMYGKKFPYVKIEASIKDATKNPNEVFIDKYLVGQKYQGTVAKRLPEGNYIVNLGAEESGFNGNKCTCYCHAPNISLGGSPYPGQKCMVAITGKYENGMLRGAFTYLEVGKR